MTATPLALRLPVSLRLTVAVFLGGWMLIAAFPLLWLLVMSFRDPVDAFSSDPLQVIAGPRTLAANGGFSFLDVLLGILCALALYLCVTRGTGKLAPRLGGKLATGTLLGVVATAILVLAVPPLLAALDHALQGTPGLAFAATPIIGFTGEHYRAVWIGHAFYRNFINSMIVTAGVVTVSLTVGTLAGYALARTRSRLAFWLLITALVFRALPHSVLVTGYLPVFVNSRALLLPLWNAPVIGTILHLFADLPPTLYGQPVAVIAVLVAINQPFTIWMLRSFFETIPAELDEAARMDGCSHFEAFRRVIMPVMWPGIVTTGLFSFLLAYNDYLVCALLLDAQSQTMVPAITQYFNRETTTTDQIEAVAAAVSITAPLFLLVMVFQRQIVSGLTTGAVKG
jgi:multiple sugar transport system permease protein